MNTFIALTGLKWLLRGSRLVALNGLDAPDAMAPPGPSETVKYDRKHVLGHNSAHKTFGSSRSVILNRLDEPDAISPNSPQRRFRVVSSGDSELSRRDESNGDIENFALEKLPNLDKNMGCC